jgi:hypothetical protein
LWTATQQKVSGVRNFVGILDKTLLGNKEKEKLNKTKRRAEWKMKEFEIAQKK